MSVARDGVIVSNKKCFLTAFFIIGLSMLISSCASSDVTRDVTSNVDMGVQNAKNLVDGATTGTVADSYQNASQRAKGAMVGGAAGAAAGSVAAGVGALPGAAVGALLGASYGGYIDHNVSVEDQLRNRGANIIVLGDQVLIVLPSARLFEPMTPKIKSDAYSTLELTAKYINSYTSMLVKVSAHTNALGSKDVNFSLSQAQAESVARVLEASGVSARVLYASGYGGTHLVEKNSWVWDGSDNYRIEIALEKLYV
jgi:outer membrane protein OmpA-like peptidoglycan-associated protein